MAFQLLANSLKPNPNELLSLPNAIDRIAFTSSKAKLVTLKKMASSLSVTILIPSSGKPVG